MMRVKRRITFNNIGKKLTSITLLFFLFELHALVYLPGVDDQGVILGPDPQGGSYYRYDGGGTREAIINIENGIYHLYYDGAATFGTRNWRGMLATSSDLKTWTKHGVKFWLSADEKSSNPGYYDWHTATSPYFYKEGNTWYAFYVGSAGVAGGIHQGVPALPYVTMLATSNSLAGPWSKRVYEPGKEKHLSFNLKPNSYWAVTASPGHVMQNPKWTGPGDNINKKYLMFFSAAGGNPMTRTVGLARTNDLNSTDAYDNPNPTGFWEVDETPPIPPAHDVENSAVYYEPDNGYYFLFTNHVKDNLYTDANWVYWTKDIDNWPPENRAIAVDTKTSSWAKGAVGLPTLVKKDDTTLAMVYDGVRSGHGHLGREIGLSYIKLPLYPPGLENEKEGTTVVDNGEIGFTKVGTWNAVQDVGYNGYVETKNAGDGSSLVYWNPDLSVGGSYNVYAWWSPIEGAASNAQFTVYNNGIEETVVVNQGNNHSRWNKLGTWTIENLDSISVMLRDDADGTVIADAVKFELAAPLPTKIYNQNFLENIDIGIEIKGNEIMVHILPEVSYSISLRDISGKSVLKEVRNKARDYGFKNLEVGVYFLSVKFKSGTYNRKIAVTQF